MCHRGHLADPDPLSDVGSKGHHGARELHGPGRGGAGRRTAGARIHHAGALPDELRLVSLLASADLPARVAGQRLMAEHEMGELFKVIAFHRGEFWDALGFREGDRTHTL